MWKQEESSRFCWPRKYNTYFDFCLLTFIWSFSFPIKLCYLLNIYTLSTMLFYVISCTYKGVFCSKYQDGGHIVNPTHIYRVQDKKHKAQWGLFSPVTIASKFKLKKTKCQKLLQQNDQKTITTEIVGSKRRKGRYQHEPRMSQKAPRCNQSWHDWSRKGGKLAMCAPKEATGAGGGWVKLPPGMPLAHIRVPVQSVLLCFPHSFLFLCLGSTCVGFPAPGFGLCQPWSLCPAGELTEGRSLPYHLHC